MTLGAFDTTWNGGSETYITKFIIPYSNDLDNNGEDNGTPPLGIPAYQLVLYYSLLSLQDIL